MIRHNDEDFTALNLQQRYEGTRIVHVPSWTRLGIEFRRELVTVPKKVRDSRRDFLSNCGKLVQCLDETRAKGIFRLDVSSSGDSL